MMTVTLDAAALGDAASFHTAFAHALGFPAFYGRNMDAWIDCMSSLTDDHPLANVHLRNSERLTITLLNFEAFAKGNPSLAASFLECTAFVNKRYVSRNEGPRIALILQ